MDKGMPLGSRVQSCKQWLLYYTETQPLHIMGVNINADINSLVSSQVFLKTALFLHLGYFCSHFFFSTLVCG